MGNSNLESIVNKCLETCKKYMLDGLKQIAGIIDTDPEDFAEKEEVCINSQYMPRGFYCPSPTLEFFISNAHRGKIARRKVRKPTNRYLFDARDRLYFAETFYSNDSINREYIFYKDDVVYGITVDEFGKPFVGSELNVATYKNGTIQSFLWCCINSVKINETVEIGWMFYETYNYKERGILDVTHYYMVNLYRTQEAVLTNCCRKSFYVDNNVIDPNSAVLLEQKREIVYSTGDGSSTGGQWDGSVVPSGTNE